MHSNVYDDVPDFKVYGFIQKQRFESSWSDYYWFF